MAAWRLGAGRARKEDPVAHAAGVRCLAAPRDPVTAGQPLFELHAEDADRLPGALECLDGAYTVSAHAAGRGPVVLDTLRT
jgi:thymidine phosphorylase